VLWGCNGDHAELSKQRIYHVIMLDKKTNVPTGTYPVLPAKTAFIYVCHWCSHLV